MARYWLFQGINRDLKCSHSNEDDWDESRITIEPAEIGGSLDFQFHKRQGELVKNNNVVITIENQYGEALPFYSSPIGGVPVLCRQSQVMNRFRNQNK